jgi:hypothetical protein
MKQISEVNMATTQGGFPWGSFSAGALCAIGLATAETGVGLVLAAVGCGASFIND